MLWGRCYEGEGAPAFWPWIDVLRAHLQSGDAAAMRADLGPRAAEIVQLVPEIRTVLPDPAAVPPAAQPEGVGPSGHSPADPPMLEPVQARFRLFDAVTVFLKRAAIRQPLLLVLDDLHAADTSSLLLLEFLARDLAGAPILVLAAYRDVEMRRGDPLARTLGALARWPHVTRLTLTGLGVPEVARIIALTRAAAGTSGQESVAAAAMDDELADRVQRETEGNPLFVTELVRLLAAEGRLGGSADRGARRAGIGRVPQTVREVIGRRLDRLSAECNHALGAAAVMGREFDVDVLGQAVGAGAVLPLPGDALLTVLAEAEVASISASPAQASTRSASMRRCARRAARWRSAGGWAMPRSRRRRRPGTAMRSA